MSNVKLTQFEGPLELLLELITAQKLEINQIALAEVTNQYLGAISDMESVRPSELADFLVVASTLLLLKSRALLPQLPLSQAEEEAAMSLEEQLKEYRRYRDAGQALRGFFARGAAIFTRQLWRAHTGGFSPPDNPPTAADLEARLAKVIEELTAHLVPPETKTIARIASVEEKIKEILSRIERASRFTIEELAGSSNRAEIVVAFLALLFLFQQKAVILLQSGRFDALEIRKAGPNFASQNLGGKIPDNYG